MIDQVQRRAGRDGDDAAFVARAADQEPFGGEVADFHLVGAGTGVAFDHLHGRRRVRRVGGFEQDAARGLGAGVEVVVQEALRLRAVEARGEQHAVGGQPLGIVAHEQARGLDRRQRGVLDDHVRDAVDREVAVAGELHVRRRPPCDRRCSGRRAPGSSRAGRRPTRPGAASRRFGTACAIASRRYCGAGGVAGDAQRDLSRRRCRRHTRRDTATSRVTPRESVTVTVVVPTFTPVTKSTR